MKFVYSILFCLIALSTHSKNKITYLKMERTPCFGKCPSYTIEFLKTGQVIYVGKKNTKMLGTFRAKMNKSELNAFFRQFENYSYGKLAARYEVLAQDLPGMNITVIVNGKRKSVVHAEAGPRFLTQIGADIDEKIESLKWTGDKGNPPPPLENVTDVNDPNFIYEQAEKMPEFPGGEKALRDYINANIRYPGSPANKGIKGKVICKFVVDRSGKIMNTSVLEGIGPGFNEEALRLINTMPRWKPGMQNGKEVNTSFILPIFFN